MLSFAIERSLPEFTLALDLAITNETLALIGPSGCGKTTVLALLAGLRTPGRGTIRLGDRLLYDSERKVDVAPERRQLGYVFQHYALFPHLRARENIVFGLFRLSHAERERRLRETSAALGIARILDAYPGDLSGGERQRVALARALVTEPRALLLDEPLAALDVENRARIRLELAEIVARLRIPTIVVTHDYEDARILGDRVAFMHRGRIVQIGTPAELVRAPRSPFVAQFVGTNLVSVNAGGEKGDAVFDPWEVRLSRDPVDPPGSLVWEGRVVDVAHIGAMLRVHLDAGVPIVADVAPDSLDGPIRSSDRLYASVDRRAVRWQGRAASEVR